MGFTKPDLPRRRSGDLSAAAAHGADADPGPALGRARIRLAADGARHLRRQAGGLLRRWAASLVATLTSAPAAVLGMSSQLVEPADRLREGGAVDGAARDDRRGGIMGPAGRQVQADDRGHPVLGPGPGTIRLRPWRRVPFTAGDRRTWFDVALYLALLVSVVVPLVAARRAAATSLSAALPANTSGLVNPALLIPADRAAGPDRAAGQDGLPGRARRAVPARPVLLHRAPFVDMIIALKLLIVVVWVGAGVSKFGRALRQRRSRRW